MKNILKKALSIFLVTSTLISLVACDTSSGAVESSGQSTMTNYTQNTEDLYTNLQTNYGYEQKYLYTEPLHNVKGDAKFEFSSEYSPEALGQVNVNEKFTNGIINVLWTKILLYLQIQL